MTKQHFSIIAGALLALLVASSSLVAQPAETVPAAERVEQLRGEIRELETRREAVQGEDRELYTDLIQRRAPELRLALRAWVAELTAAEATPAESELLRATELTVEQREWVLGWLQTADAQIEALREELPDAEPRRELEIENSLTQVNERVDEMLTTLLDLSEDLETLGADPDYEPLDERFLRRAELTSARVEKVLDDIAVAEQRLALLGEGDAASEQQTHLAALREKLSGTTGTLERMAELLERRGQDASTFRELLLEATGQLTVRALDAEVAISFLERTLTRWRSTVIEGAPTWIFRGGLFLLIILVAWLLSRFVRRLLTRLLSHARADFSRLLEKFIISTSANLVLLLGALVALSQVGIEVAPFLAGLGVAGVVLGLALQDTLSNLFSGLMILLTRPYDVDDIVDAAGVSGTVREMNLMTTTILTFDNKKLVVPNNMIWGDTIQNVTAQSLRRVDLEFGVGYEEDVERVAEVLRELVTAHELVLAEPEPNIRLHRLDDSAVTFIVRPWVQRDDYWTVYWDLMRNVKRRFDAEGISIPFPQRDVHLKNVPQHAPGAVAAGEEHEASERERSGEDAAVEPPD